MFHSLGKVVNRGGVWIVLAWSVTAVVLWWFAPDWNSVTKDDDVSFFPANSPSVIGQGLLKRGFPNDLSNSSAVIVAERPEGRFSGDDLRFVDNLAAAIRAELADEDGTPGPRKAKGFGVRSVLDRTRRDVGSRLLSKPADGIGQVALIVVQLRGTYVSRDARLAVEKIRAMTAEAPKPPAGLKIEMTGSAMVGYDTHVASLRSVEDTTIATFCLVVLILLVV